MYYLFEARMKTEEFAKFVESQQEPALKRGIDWGETREQWLVNLDSLYRQILEFLREYISTGSIKYDFDQIELSEQGIGRYIAKRMEITIGRQRVSLVPVGTLIIGSRGRVDAEGSAGRAQILLVDEKARNASDLVKVTVTVGRKGTIPPPPAADLVSWRWKIVTTSVPRRFVDLDKESFFALLMEIANG